MNFFLMVTKGPKLREFNNYGHRLKHRQPKFKIIEVKSAQYKGE